LRACSTTRWSTRCQDRPEPAECLRLNAKRVRRKRTGQAPFCCLCDRQLRRPGAEDVGGIAAILRRCRHSSSRRGGRVGHAALTLSRADRGQGASRPGEAPAGDAGRPRDGPGRSVGGTWALVRDGHRKRRLRRSAHRGAAWAYGRARGPLAHRDGGGGRALGVRAVSSVGGSDLDRARRRR
jgi:hypothetical protein